MPKVRVLKEYPFGVDYYFHCPGCDLPHSFRSMTDGSNYQDSFDEDMERPTVTTRNDSLLYPNGCSLNIEAGRIHYGEDCPHPLAGQTVEMSEVEDLVVAR